MSKPRSASLILLAAVTIFVSAFLLFQVQPLISKKILPWFGGSPAVWTTCMLFFQVLLLGGYAYAHLLTKYVSPRWQGWIHAGLLIVAVVTLPIIPSDWWKPADGTKPSLRILALLAAEVGVPYFLLSTTGPLIQAWFALANPGKSPYRLYALSNVGSLGALLTYPFIFEQFFTVDWQGWMWSAAFVLFALLAGGMGLWIWRIAARLEAERIEPAELADPSEAKAAVPLTPPWYHQLGWLLLAALPSMTFLAITNHLCQDVAGMPLLFIVPLSLYLLTLIICFDREVWYSRIFFGVTGALAIALLCGLENATAVDDSLAKLHSPMTFTGTVNAMLGAPEQIGFFFNRWLGTNNNWAVPFTVEDYEDDVYFQAVMYLTVLFLGCMLCHGELVKLKPAPRHLTKYYLMISAGGALGGLFVALISPSVFVRPYELPLSIVGCFAVAMLALFFAGQRWKFTRQEMVQWSAAFACVGCFLLIAASQVNREEDDVEIVTRLRNFYGAIEVRRVEVTDDSGETHEGRSLYHGRILHGFQYLSDSRIDQITTYYGPNSGPGLAVRHHPKRVAGKPINVGIVGLGTGTMAGFAQAGDYFCFYDIDPKIVQLHERAADGEPPIFQFVDRARQRGAEVPIELGDARLTMEREANAKSKQYDIIVLDAFSGDAIPAHLLTLECVKIYDDLLRRDDNGNSTGILAIHISNRYLDLAPVVTALAKEYGFEEVPVDDNGGADEWDTSSNWVLLTRNQKFLDDVVIKAAIAQATPTPAWHILQPAAFKSAGGARGKIDPDGTILVGGNRPASDTYMIRFETSLADISAIKIEALTDKSLPGEGPGRGQQEQGSFVLQTMELSLEEGGSPKVIPLTQPSADASATGYDVAGAIDNDESTGWGIGDQTGQDHLASFDLVEPLYDPAQRTLTLRLTQNAGSAQTLGKFRVSVLGVEKKPPVMWTDQWSNLWSILK